MPASFLCSVLRYERLFEDYKGCRVSELVSFQLPLKPTSGKPTKRDGIPRSNEFSASVNSYSLPKDFSWFYRDSAGFLPPGTFEVGSSKKGNEIKPDAGH